MNDKLKEIRDRIAELHNDPHNGDYCYRLAVDYALAIVDEALAKPAPGSFENPFKGTFSSVCFQRHDSKLGFGACERDDGFEFVVLGSERDMARYVLHPDATMERLDAPTLAEPAKPEPGDEEAGK